MSCWIVQKDEHKVTGITEGGKNGAENEEEIMGEVFPDLLKTINSSMIKLL